MRRLLLLFTPLLSLLCYAQKETSNWFLYRSRISVAPSGVTTGLPIPLSSELNPVYASTSVSDSAGNLLFACDEDKIINKNLITMPAFDRFSLNCSSGIVMAQKIPSSNRWLVFYNSPKSTTALNSPWILKFAVIDLTLNGGTGDVVTYNQVVNDRLSKGYTIVQARNGQDAWLVTHHCATDSFFSYKITAAGFSSTPVISVTGLYAPAREYFFGDIKTSPDGKLVAGISYAEAHVNFLGVDIDISSSFVEAYTYDNNLGRVQTKVRSRRDIGPFYDYQTVEFSPDNRLLYVGRSYRDPAHLACGAAESKIMQYNLCYNDSIRFSRYAMMVVHDFPLCGPNLVYGNIQLGADKKIHMPYTGSAVSTFTKPTIIGSSCNYNFNSYQVPANNGGKIATPHFQHKLLEKAVKNNIVYTGGCFPSPQSFSITNDTITTALWDFGDPASGNNTASSLNPSHSFSNPGFYTVTAQLYNSQSQLMESLSQLLEIKDPNRRLLEGYPRDTSFCQGGSLIIKLKVVNGIFAWYLNDTRNYYSAASDSLVISSSGTYYVEMRQNDCNGCVMLDSIHVTVRPTAIINLGPDRNLCAGDSIFLFVPNSPRTSFLWNTGDTTNAIWIHHGGWYWLQGEIANNGCPRRDSIYITEVPGVQFSLPADTTLCPQQTLLLDPGIANAFSYQWQDGSLQQTYTVTQPGNYWVTVVSAAGCRHTDTIAVNYFTPQMPTLGNDTTLCEGYSLYLNAHVLFANSYLWNTGATADNITVNQTGQYWVEVNDGKCAVRDSIQVTFISPPLLSLGSDTSLCENETMVLYAAVPGATYLWQNGDPSDSFLVDQPGLYWLQVNKDGCVVTDSINITFNPIPSMNLGPDVSFCKGDNAILHASNGFIQWLWNDGASSQQLPVYNSGSYSVTGITSTGCKAYDTVLVTVYALPVVRLNHDPNLCTGNTRTLDAGGGFTSYLWNTGSNAQTILINGTGLYSVTVTDNNGCKGSDTAVVNRLLPLPANFLPADVAICSYDDHVIDPLRSYRQYLWSTSDISRQITVSAPGVYWLEVADNNDCKGRDSINITLRDCPEGLFVPSAFTPNNDGTNDQLIPYLFGRIKQFDFVIYNRWGQKVFETRQSGKGWDGNVRGLQQTTNVFVWFCTYQLAGQEAKTAKGTITLIR